MLSKQERKYRGKIITKYRMKKDCQIYIDNYVKTNILTYKSLYLDDVLLNGILLRYRFNMTMKRLGTSLDEATKSFKRLSTDLVISCGDFKNLSYVVEE